MRVPLFVLAITAAFFVDSSPAEAMFFGRSEKIYKIRNIDDEYEICHKLTIYYFVAGVYLKDDGYVARERGITDSYIPLTKEMISEIQAEGLLPKPLPKYSIPLTDYAAGYSLWLIIGGIALCGGIGSLINKFSGNSAGPTQSASDGAVCGVQLELGEELPPVCALCGAPAETFKAKRFQARDGASLGIGGGLAGSIIDDAETPHYTFSLPLCWDHARTPNALGSLQAAAHGPRSAIVIGVAREFAVAVQQEQEKHAQDVGETMRSMDQE